MYKRRETGEGPAFIKRKKTRVSCDEFGATMSASFIHQHTEQANRTVTTKTSGVDVGGRGMDTYLSDFPQVLKTVACPVDRFPERTQNPG